MTFEQIGQLDLQAPEGAFSTFDMEVLIPEVEKIPGGGCYLEVGVDKGKSLWIARQVAKPNVVVAGVDLNIDPNIKGTWFMQRDSIEISKSWNRKIDVLFIDGDHTYEGCKADIEAWHLHMKKGSVMLFHDCDESSPDVVQAVNEFGKKLGRKVQLFKTPEKNTSMAKIQL